MAKTYQGHKNRACWNVALYLFNDYGLYSLVKEEVAATRTLDDAAVALLDRLVGNGMTHTPDGYRFSKTAIRLALQGYER